MHSDIGPVISYYQREKKSLHENKSTYTQQEANMK